MTSRLRICFVHNKYRHHSGEEHAVHTLAALAAAHGHEISWFLRSSEGLNRWTEKVHAFFSGIYSPSARAALTKHLAETPVDLVQAQNLYPWLSPSVLAACRNAQIPVVMRCPNYRLFCPNGLHLCKGEICERCLHGREYWCVLRNCEDNMFRSTGYALRNAFARMTGSIIKNVTVFVVLSEFQKRRFVAGGIDSNRIEILPNTVPLDAGDPASDSQQKQLVTYVGRISEEKGIRVLLDAARQLPELQFAVAGRCSERQDLIRNAPDNVRWLGFVSGDALRQVYMDSRFLVVPSTCFEAFTNVIPMAMWYRKPVIASRLGALPEIVDDQKTGLLSEPGCASDLAAKIDALFHDPRRCRDLGERGRRKAEREYSPNAVYERLLAIYRKALDIARYEYG